MTPAAGGAIDGETRHRAIRTCATGPHGSPRGDSARHHTAAAVATTTRTKKETYGSRTEPLAQRRNESTTAAVSTEGTTKNTNLCTNHSAKPNNNDNHTRSKQTNDRGPFTQHERSVASDALSDGKLLRQRRRGSRGRTRWVSNCNRWSNEKREVSGPVSRYDDWPGAAMPCTAAAAGELNRTYLPSLRAHEAVVLMRTRKGQENKESTRQTNNHRVTGERSWRAVLSPHANC